jgi:curved DNA-binding protein CbpA
LQFQLKLISHVPFNTINKNKNKNKKKNIKKNTINYENNQQCFSLKAINPNISLFISLYVKCLDTHGVQAAHSTWKQCAGMKWPSRQLAKALPVNDAGEAAPGGGRAERHARRAAASSPPNSSSASRRLRGAPSTARSSCDPSAAAAARGWGDTKSVRR